ncbi:MAG: hypothetical protein EHM13_13350, partial [Acidobacteria bacterium]
MRETKNRGVAVGLIVAYMFALLPNVVSGQTVNARQQLATVTQDAPIYLRASVSQAPLRVAAAGTVLRVLQQQGDWVQVEFSDPQWGRRVGWVQLSLVRIEGLQPMDLSVPAVSTGTQPSGREPEPRPAVERGAERSAEPSTGDTLADGMLEGEMLAERTRTSGKLALGLGVGVLTGVIGTGIGYFVVGPEPVSADVMYRYSNRSPEYQLGFKTG